MEELSTFVKNSPTPYHVVSNAIAMLHESGFSPLTLEQDWSSLSAGAYYVKPGDGNLFAFVLPKHRKWNGFRVLGAHTDSPNLRLKPNPAYEYGGYAQLGVEIYGSPLLNSWLDRDLSLAGRVLYKEQDRLVTRLVHFEKPLLRIPQLAIHLDREVNEKGLVLDKQEHLNPIMGLLTKDIPSLKELCATHLGLGKSDVVRTELMLYDTQPPVLLGAYDEFFVSSRLDNQLSCHAALRALLHAYEKPSPSWIPMVALFDHEEVGSQSAYGAEAPTLPSLLERIVMSQRGSREAYHQALAQSLCVSADAGHALHPNYSKRHDPHHRPVLNGGPLIKTNAQQRYATSGLTAAWMQTLAHQHHIPVQFYVNRSDLPCGSTIGPITSTLLGIPTVDVGHPLLSMHSIREMAGTLDHHLMIELFTAALSSPLHV